jgi:lipopolysaccharide transport system permease protein
MEKSKLTETVYTPDNRSSSLARNPLDVFRQIILHRELIWQLVYRDFSARHRQSIFGYLWAVVLPLIAVAIFAFLAKYRVLPMGQTNMPYVVFGLWSFSVWHLFSGCLTACTTSLTSGGALVTKINFPKYTLVIASIGRPMTDFLIRAVFLAAVFIYFDFVPAIQSLYISVLMLILILQAVGIGLLLSVLNLVIRDVANFVGMFAIFGMFLAPVLYPPPTHWPFLLVNILNPVSPILIATQDLLSIGHLTRPFLLLGSSLFSLAVFIIGWRLFNLLLPRIIERA